MTTWEARAESYETERFDPAADYDDAEVARQLQQFLDEWYFRILNSSIGKDMSRWEAEQTLLEVLEMVGVQFSPEDKDEFTSWEEDEGAVSRIASRMPMALRQRWEYVALQLKAVVLATSRVRKAAEVKGENADESVARVFEDSPENCVLDDILQGAVVFSAKSVANLRRIHATWRKSTDARIDRLARSFEDGEQAAQETLALEKRLADLDNTHKSTGKATLLKLANGQDTVLKRTTFDSWHDHLMKSQAEKEIRQRFEDQIAEADRKFFQYKESQMANVRSVMTRMCCEEDEAIMRDVWSQWRAEISTRHDTTEELKRIQEKIREFEQAAAANATKVMARMGGNCASVLMLTCFQAWISCVADNHKEKELEDAVKATEAALQKHLQEKKDEARHVLDKMAGSCDAGLLALSIQHWLEYVAEEKADREREEALRGQASKLKSFTDSMRQANGQACKRVNQQLEWTLLQRIYSAWLLETKVNVLSHHFGRKYNTKKQQLQGVQNLFKSFAVQLEANLGADDDDMNATARSGFSQSQHSTTRKRGKHKGMTRDYAGSSSLPDIHQRRNEQSLLT